MLRHQRFLRFAFVIAVCGCASTTTIEQTWHAQNAPQLTHVATLSPQSDAGLRRSAEDKLAQQLASHGVYAVPGYTVLNDQDLASKDQIVTKLRAQGFDGVVAMRLVEANQKLQYYPGFDGYWGGAWGMGGTVVPETIVRVEINAYSLANQQLVYSALSKSVDPESAKQLIGDVSRVASNNLAQSHVIAPAQATMR